MMITFSFVTRIFTKENHELYLFNWRHRNMKNFVYLYCTCNSLGPSAPDKAYSRKHRALSNLGYDGNF